MREVSSIIIDLSGMKIVSKGKHQKSDTNFLEKLYKEVKEEYNNNRDILIEFFTNHGFDKEQSDDLAYKMRNAVYYIKRDKPERRKIEKVHMKILRDNLKKNIGSVKSLIDNLDILRELFPDVNIAYKLVHKFTYYHMRLEAMPRAGTNIFFRLALIPLFWKLEKLGYGQAKQINLVYDLFYKYELDDYGTESEDGTTYIGEKEQKDRIRTQFQQPAFKYWKEFDQRLGWI